MPRPARSWTRTAAVALAFASLPLTTADHTSTVQGSDRGSGVVSATAASGVDRAPFRRAPLGDRVGPFLHRQQPEDGRAVPLSAGEASSTFGTLVVDDGTFRCSAAVVTSRSRRLLSTAAHCVWLDGRWTLDGAYFVPGYRSGSEPWGRWAVEAAWVPRSWQEANSPIEHVASAHDVAFVRLADNASGQAPEDVLGSQGVWFAAPAALTVTAAGYPATGAFDGEQLRSCTGSTRLEQISDDGSAGSSVRAPVLAMDCDMTEGSSGGPWLVGSRARSGRGQIVGVVSGGSDHELMSPRFGAEAEEVYRAADAGHLNSDGPS